MDRMGYGKLIRDAREARKWTQAQLAKRMNTSPSTISNLEREQHPPTVPDEVNDLVLTLGLSPIELLERMGVRIRPSPLERLPRELQEALERLRPEDLSLVTPLVLRLADAGRLRLQSDQ